MQRRREGLLDGVPQAQEWGWATDRLELVEIEVARELSTEVESRATGADDASLGAATDLVREVRAAVLAGDVPAARTRWERLEQVVERWDDAPLTGRIRSTGVTLFGGLVEIAATPGPPAFLAPPAVRPGDRHVDDRHADAGPASTRDLVVRVVLCVLAVVLTLTAAVVSGRHAVTQLHADTPVRAPVQGCTATVTGADGVPREVSLRVYKGACLQPDADGQVTVYVDADDPTVLAARRWWVWWTSAAVAATALAVLAARSAGRAAVELVRRRDRD